MPPPPPITPSAAGSASGSAPGTLTQDERTWGLACHLSALAGIVLPTFGHILGPLIVWLVKKDTMPFVDDQGKESLNFQLTVTIALFVSGLLCFVLIGLVLLPAVILADVILVILAAIKANEGVAYRYPYNIRFIK
jgi:uncharacterized Tic20 family protein